MGTAYEAILRNLSASAKIKAGSSRRSVDNARFLNELKTNYLRNINVQAHRVDPVAEQVVGPAVDPNANATRDLAMSVMSNIVPTGNFSTAVPTASSVNKGKKGSNDFSSFFGKAFRKFGSVTGSDTGFSAIGEGIGNAFSTGPGKWAIKQLTRSGSAVGGAADYIDTRPFGNDREALDPEAKNLGDAISRGWTGKSHIYPGTVLKKELGLGDPTKDKNFGEGALEFAVGLFGDVAFDPLSYIPVTKLARGGKPKKAPTSDFFGENTPVVSRIRPPTTPEPSPVAPPTSPLNTSVPLQRVTPDFAGTKAERNTNVLKSKGAQNRELNQAFFDTYLKPTIAGEGKQLEVFKPPRFAAGPAGVVADTANPVSFADELLSKKITDSVSAAPRLAHPGLDVRSPYRSVETSTTQRVPKVITEEVPVVKSSVAEKAQDAISPKVARFRATKMALLQAPGHKLNNGFTVEQLQAAARANPKRATEIKKILHAEAVRIFNEKDYTDLPKLIEFRGRSGEKSPLTLSREQVADLFSRGEIPANLKNYDEAASEFTRGFPLHDVEDLKNMHLNNSSGETVSLHDYLSDYNVPVKSVSPDGTIKDVIVPKPAGMDFGEIPNFEVAPATRTRSKTVYEDVVTKKTTVKRIKGAEALAWQLEHSGKLSPAELKYISHPSLKPETFEARVAELRLKQVAGNFKTLKEFVEAAKAGDIPKEFLDDLFKNLGLKNLADLERKATAILKKTGPKKTDFNFKLQELPTSSGKVERSSGPSPQSEWDRMHDGVETPQQIMARVEVEGAQVLAKPRPTPSPILNADVEKALKDAIRKNLKTPQTSAYPYKSNRGTLRTDTKLREGVGRNLKGWNSFSQGDALSSLILSASSRFKKSFATLSPAEKKVVWKKRASFMYDQVMPATRVIDNYLNDNGVKIIAGKDDHGILMSTADVLESLPRHIVEKYLFAPPGVKFSTVRPTGITNAAEQLVRAALHDGDLGLAKEAAYQALMDPKTGGSFALHGLKGQQAARHLVGQLTDSMPLLLQRVNENYAEHSIKVGTSVTSMTQATVDKIAAMNADPTTSAAETFSALMGKDADIAATGRAIRAPAEATPLARVLADTGLASKGIQPGDLAEAKTATAVVAASKAPKKELDKMFTAGMNQQKSRVAEAETLSETFGEATRDIMDYVNLRVEAGLFRSYTPLLGKVSVLGEHLGRAYKTNKGMPDIHESLWKSRNTTMEFGRMHRALMSDLSKYVADTAGLEARQYEQQAWKALQSGEAVADQAMIPVVNAMKDSIDLMFTAGEKGNASLAIRNGLLPNHINDALDYFGAPQSMRFMEDVPLSEQADIWKTWDNVTDPLDALDKVFAGYQFALTDSTVGRTFSVEFGSPVAKEGYVKLTDKGKNSVLYNFIDTNLYYPDDIAKQIPYYDTVRKAATEGISNKNMAHALQMYDTALHGIKTGLTVVRPGHHASNLMGDMLLSMIAGVNNPLVYRKGMRVLAGRGKFYNDWDGIKALAADTEKYGVIAGKDIKVGSKFKLTDDETFRAAHQEGLLGGFRQTQALDFNEGQAYNAGSMSHNISTPRKAGRAYMHAAGQVADVINHQVRMAHFIDALGKSKAATLNDAIKEAGSVVRRWHPDGSDLTPFERKYMRRSILFYSWMKKSTPLIMMAMLQKPGRVLVLPKAQYEFAEVMGMNPDSMADPFPQDSIYPSFITDGIFGPQFMVGDKEMGLGLPGDPVSGTAKTMNNPIGSILSGMTPFARVPAEITMGDHNSGEFANPLGSPISVRDKSDYIDSQIPILSDAARITNFSPTGMEAQNDVAKGNSNPGVDRTALINFLTGIGLKQYNKPSYERSAMFELREKQKRERGN